MDVRCDLDDGWLGQRAHVPQVRLVVGNLLQHPPHDFTGPAAFTPITVLYGICYRTFIPVSQALERTLSHSSNSTITIKMCCKDIGMFNKRHLLGSLTYTVKDIGYNIGYTVLLYR
jgi:hypothetical protein